MIYCLPSPGLPSPHLQMPFNFWQALVCKQVASAERWQVTTSCGWGVSGLLTPFSFQSQVLKRGLVLELLISAHIYADGFIYSRYRT